MCARRKEDDCNLQRAVYVGELNSPRSSLRILSVPGFWIVGVFLQTKKVCSVHPGLNHKLLCVALRVRCEDAKGP